ncbi:hypothetical protein ONZ45_g16284 [Pleurotus djamor]|nr:hypothetical protein ONZ45_g16284 [Pleurotus djamor]
MSSLPCCTLCHQPLPVVSGTPIIADVTTVGANVGSGVGAAAASAGSVAVFAQFFANVAYYNVPTQPLQPIIERVYARWYAVFTGFYVGIFNDLNVYNKAVVGAPGGQGRRFPSQSEAVAAFNTALLSNSIRVAKLAVPAPMVIDLSDTEEIFVLRTFLGYKFSNDNPGMLSLPPFPPHNPTLPISNPMDELDNAFGRLQVSDRTVYEVTSTTFNGVTTDWSTAAHATQGEPGSHVRALEKRSKNRRVAAAYAVFIGRYPGVYTTWSEVKGSVDGMASACFQGYSSHEHALAAFMYALRHRRYDRPWVQTISETRPFVRPRFCYYHLHPHCAPENPLNDGCTARKRFYVVYKGRSPGVYTTWLETHIETTGLSGAAHESFASIYTAADKFHEAEQRGEVTTL